MWLVLLLQTIPLTISVRDQGYFIYRLQNGSYAGDEPSYLLFPFSSLHAILDNYRTVGLPIVIHLYNLFFHDFTFWPHVQYIIYLVSVLFLFWVLLKSGFDKYFSIILVSCLLWNMEVYTFMQFILTELLCLSFLNITVGLMLLAVNNNKFIILLVFSLSLFFLYQIRPNVSYVAILAPFWAAGFATIRYGFVPSRLKNMFFRFAAVSYIPLLLLAALRFLVLGQFGISTMSGALMAAHSLYYLDEKNVATLMGESRRLGDEFLRWKRSVFYYNLPCNTSPHNESAMIGTKMTEIEARCFHPEAIIVMNGIIKHDTGKEPTADATMNFQPWNYPLPLSDFHVQYYHTSMDKKLAEFATDILKTEWKRYFHWLVFGSFYGLTVFAQSVLRDPTMNKFYTECFIMAVIVQVLFCKGIFNKSQSEGWQKQIAAFMFMAITNFIVGYMLLIIINFPFSRMFVTLTPYIFPVLVLSAVPPFWLKRKNEIH